MSLDAVFAFVGLIPGGGEQRNNDGLDESVVQLMRLDAWIATVETCLIKTETQGVHHQSLHSNI